MSRVFISHSALDKTFARLLASDLKSNGHEPWLDEWEIRVGECILTKIDRGIEDSEFVIVVLSKHSVESGWVEKEWKTKYWSEIRSGKTLVLPVLIEDCKLPTILSTKKYADFRQGYPVAFADLVAAMDAASITDEGTSHAPTKSNDFDYYWHRGVQEYFGHTLHLTFVKYTNASIVFKDSILGNMRDCGVQNYMIFELFSEWDILIRHWSTEQQAANLVACLEKNIDVQRTDPLSVTRMHHIYEVGEHYPSAEEMKGTVDEIGLAPLKDIQAKKERSEYFQVARQKGILLRDKISFDPHKLQFYIVVRSLKRPSAQLVTILLKQLERCKPIVSKTLYLTFGTSIRMVLKGQTDKFYCVSELLTELASSFQGAAIDASTETVLVANGNVRVNNTFDFDRAEEALTEKGFEKLAASVGIDPTISLSVKYELKAKYHRVLGLLLMDGDGVLTNLLSARLANDPSYIKRIKDYFPQFEELMQRNLQRMIRKEYGNNWQEMLDAVKDAVGIKKDIKADKLTLGDLCQVFRHVALEKHIVELGDTSEAQFKEIMDQLPEFRNRLAHTGASLKGWEELFDFCCRFVPIRRRFQTYFESLS
ncbi:MAG: TIR domain-containing protein [Pirellulaceae bacterium]|nr:TIR domain-containing protein [Pirellulaceae bacterium]